MTSENLPPLEAEWPCFDILGTLNTDGPAYVQEVHCGLESMNGTVAWELCGIVEGRLAGKAHSNSNQLLVFSRCVSLDDNFA